MNRPKLNITIVLKDKSCSNEHAETCFSRLKAYLMTASDGNCTINNDDLNISIGNNFLSAPTRIFLKTLPIGKEFFPFDLQVKITNDKILTVELNFVFFWTLLYYLFMLCGGFALSLFATKGNIHNILYLLLFFSIPITLYCVSISIARVLLLKRKIKAILS